MILHDYILNNLILKINIKHDFSDNFNNIPCFNQVWQEKISKIP